MKSNSGDAPLVQNVGRYKIYLTTSYSNIDFSDLLAHHAKLCKASPEQLIKCSPNRSISLLPLSTTSQQNFLVVVKEYRYPLNQRVRKIFYKHRARQAWDAARCYASESLPVPEHIALIEERSIGLVTRAYLVTRYIDGALPLYDFIKREYSSSQHKSDKRSLLQTLANDFRRQHQNHIYNRDTKAENIIIRRGPNGMPERYYVDLDGVSHQPFWFNWFRVHSLAGLNAALAEPITKADRLFFVRHYFGQNLRGDRLRWWARRIMRATIKRNHFWPRPRAPLLGLLPPPLL